MRDEFLALLKRGDVDGFNEVSRRRREIVDLSRADLAGARLEGVDLAGACLDGAKLTRARLPGADLSGASLRFANLEKANLEGADLSRANLYAAYLAEARVEGVYLAGADVASAVFPSDVRAEEIRAGIDLGLRLRHDPAVALLRKMGGNDDR